MKEQTVLSLVEIDQKIVELQQMRVQAEEAAREELLETERNEAMVIYDRLVEDVLRLNTLGFLPERLSDALTDSEGKLNPRRFIKKRGNLQRGRTLPVSELKSKAAKPHGSDS